MAESKAVTYRWSQLPGTIALRVEISYVGLWKQTHAWLLPTACGSHQGCFRALLVTMGLQGEVQTLFLPSYHWNGEALTAFKAWLLFWNRVAWPLLRSLPSSSLLVTVGTVHGPMNLQSAHLNQSISMSVILNESLEAIWKEPFSIPIERGKFVLQDGLVSKHMRRYYLEL